ncbi:MAG TPA: trehalose-phosphatase [Ramlibacter sp.]|uniref:trehalose-phosphatase n=1 Tax=Ramlibacter sp. TaxID=1917967 RepID=UPI002D7E3552|nr:trehalose-phosphatase [Ramlibacter sp.]HET8748941.1 trehalose-phosphatase [Ramlibacter sp.]
MPLLLQARGDAALAAVMRRGPLLAFDFDGTLAPIVPRPEQARVSACVSGKLRRLAARLPVAIVSGRSGSDIAHRLGFEPHYIVGNHGAELVAQEQDATASQLDPVRALLQARGAELRQAGVMVEDKGLSLALHYRLAPRPQQALELIRATLREVQAQCHTFAGKMVENVVPAGAPDKGRAMHLLVQECGAPCAVFFGDDVNDEPVFASAPEDWLTVRIGREDRNSRARYFLDHVNELGMVLERMLAHLDAPVLQAG